MLWGPLSPPWETVGFSPASVGSPILSCGAPPASNSPRRPASPQTFPVISRSSCPQAAPAIQAQSVRLNMSEARHELGVLILETEQPSRLLKGASCPSHFCSSLGPRPHFPGFQICPSSQRHCPHSHSPPGASSAHCLGVPVGFTDAPPSPWPCPQLPSLRLAHSLLSLPPSLWLRADSSSDYTVSLPGSLLISRQRPPMGSHGVLSHTWALAGTNVS